jgi:DNA repair exonuclease SbcCD ATPase subunit
MTDHNDDTRMAPEEDQPDTGQVEEQSPETSPADAGREERERLEKLERSYKELQAEFTRKSQRLAEIERARQQQPPQDSTPSPEEFYSDPVQGTMKVVSKVFSEYEARQEQRRQAEEYLQSRAEEAGIPIGEMKRLYRDFVEASNDPDRLTETLVSIHRARHADSQLQSAKKTVQDAVTRNARAVTTETAGTNTSPPGKSFDDMSLQEQREYLIKKLGAPSPEY